MTRGITIGTGMLLAWMLAGCDTRKPDVWDLYDVRHPVGSGAVYRDNDATYTPPHGGNYCTQSDLENMGC